MGFFTNKLKKLVFEDEDDEEELEIKQPEMIEEKPEEVEEEVKTKPKPKPKTTRAVNPPVVNERQDILRKISTVTERLNRFSVNERMDLMEKAAESVIKGDLPCALIGGSPGLGKTHTVVENLLRKKYKYVENEDYLIIKAGVSAFGVYKYLCQWQEKAEKAKVDAEAQKKKGQKVKPKVPVVVFDDVPIWSDKTLVDMMKALMDTSSRRQVTWLTDRAEMDPEKAKKLGKLPAQLVFTGGVIVITNEPEKKMNKAVLDRTFYLPIEVTDEEMKTRMRTICPKLEEGMDARLKQDVLDWITSDKYEGEQRSMRTLVKALRLARAAPKGTDRNGRPHWEKMVSIVN